MSNVRDNPIFLQRMRALVGRRLSFFACLSMVFPVFVSQAQVGPIRVACVGNSITYGGLGDLSYPQQLGKLLGSHYDVRNYGQNGRTMLRKGDLPYWNEASFLAVREFSPQILIISLGTNDSKPQNWLYGNEFFSDYMDFVGAFRDSTHHPQIFVCFPTPAFVDTFGISDSIIHGQIIPLIDSVRATAKTLSIDFYHQMLDKGSLFPDGIHPDADGYTVMAHIVFDAITNSPAGFSRYFTTSSPTFEKGDPVTLYWETTRGSHVTLNGVAVGESDSTVVFPTGTAQYTLIAQGPLFSDTSRVTVQYLPSGTIQSFAATPMTLVRGAGDSCLLRWTTTKGTSATLDGLPVDPNSERRAAPSSTRTYTLATTGDIADTARVTVQVVNPAPTIGSVAPALGYRDQKLTVVVTGSGFISGVTTVSLGANISTLTTVNSTTRLTVALTMDLAAAEGPRDVVVTNVPPGGGSVVLTNGFDVETYPTSPVPVVLLSPMRGDIVQSELVRLRWLRGSATINRFWLDLSADSVFAYKLSDSTVTDTSHILLNLAKGTRYWWRVRAANAWGWGPPSETWSFSTIVALPEVVTLVFPSDGWIVPGDSFRALWNQGTPAITKYWIEFAKDSAFASKSVDSSVIDSSYTVRGLTAGAQYWWRVRACNAAGWGPFSETRRFFRSLTDVGAYDIIPESFCLYQNYPNPFNPSTTIRYGVPRRSHVTITVFNTLGQMVAQLVNEEVEAGYQEVRFDGSNLSSGLYAYHIHAGDFVSTRKLLLLR